MKALSLWQPYATLMAIGAKPIETRGWSTKYRGPLGIHAAKRFAQDERHLCMEEPFVSALTAAGFTNLRDLPLGAILAVVELVDVVPTGRTLFEVNTPWSPADLAFGNFTPGRFAWKTENPRRFKEPILWRGRQQLFDVPDDVIAKGLEKAVPESRDRGDP